MKNLPYITNEKTIKLYVNILNWNKSSLLYNLS